MIGAEALVLKSLLN